VRRRGTRLRGGDVPSECERNVVYEPTLYECINRTGGPVPKSEPACRNAGQGPAPLARNSKRVTVFKSEARDGEGSADHNRGWVSYSATIERAAFSYGSWECPSLRRSRAARPAKVA